MKGHRYRTQPISAVMNRCQTSSASIKNPEVKYSAIKFKNVNNDSRDGAISKFNLINWRKQRYFPSQNEQRLKFQNDISLHLIVNEKTRPKIKTVQHSQSTLKQVSSALKINYRHHYDQIKGGLTASKLGMDQLEELDSQHEECSISAFKQHHQQLCSYVSSNFNQMSKQHSKDTLINESVDSKPLLPYVKQVKQTNKLIYIKTQNVIKTNNVHINGRIQQILKKWKGGKKSINQRFYQIWGPSSQKKNHFMMNRRNKSDLNQFQDSAVVISRLQSDNKGVNQQ